MLQPFLLALQFLTRLPIPLPGNIEPEVQGRSVIAYPLVGLVIGLLVAIPAYVASASDPMVIAALMLTVWVLVTGGLHFDGLADSADAWLGGQGNTTRTLEIMKDPRSGPAAIVLVALVLLLKLAALTALVRAGELVAVLLIPMLGRAAIVGLFLTTVYVRVGGLGASLARSLPRQAGMVVIGIVALLFLTGGAAGLQSLVCAGLTVVGLRALMIARIGGATGDTLGATVEISEAAALLGWVLAL
ncbi:MAG: adenosylcobinamide-GDP ribazoletransferase [Proteobacteria bacterium]|nr:MAG: adenosylcobinamide-GDP ribazoletransferase [Pseudomonadota bacterium]